MVNTARNLTTGLAFTVTLLTAIESFAAELFVRVDNLAAVPVDTVRAAEERAAEVFARIGVHAEPVPGSVLGLADTDDLAMVIVRLDNLAAVPVDSLRFAENRAAEVFTRIGARVRWIDQEAARREGIQAPFTLVLVNAVVAVPRVTLLVDALGFADLTVRRAHVFYDRVEALNLGASRSIASILGDVMAHELGHLLLPLPGHARDGIMRPGINVNKWALETFTPSQAQAIRSRLRTLRR